MPAGSGIRVYILIVYNPIPTRQQVGRILAFRKIIVFQYEFGLAIA